MLKNIEWPAIQPHNQKIKTNSSGCICIVVCMGAFIGGVVGRVVGKTWRAERDAALFQLKIS